LTGSLDELAEHFSRHMDINSIALDFTELKWLKKIEENSACNVKRVRRYGWDWTDPRFETPYLISDFCEVKTTWHPID
jgi:hypothetical protein